MYFESQEFAEKFTRTIAAVLVENSNTTTSTSTASHARQVSNDISNIDLQTVESKSTSTPTISEADSTPKSTPGPTRKNTRRKSLAEFQEINDAVGVALSVAESCDSGDADFNKAVGEQVVHIH